MVNLVASYSSTFCQGHTPRSGGTLTFVSCSKARNVYVSRVYRHCNLDAEGEIQKSSTLISYVCSKCEANGGKVVFTVPFL